MLITRLDAINTLLASIALAPVSDPEIASHPQAQVAALHIDTETTALNAKGWWYNETGTGTPIAIQGSTDGQPYSISGSTVRNTATGQTYAWGSQPAAVIGAFDPSFDSLPAQARHVVLARAQISFLTEYEGSQAKLQAAAAELQSYTEELARVHGEAIARTRLYVIMQEPGWWFNESLVSSGAALPANLLKVESLSAGDALSVRSGQVYNHLLGTSSSTAPVNLYATTLVQWAALPASFQAYVRSTAIVEAYQREGIDSATEEAIRQRNYETVTAEDRIIRVSARRTAELCARGMWFNRIEFSTGGALPAGLLRVEGTPQQPLSLRAGVVWDDINGKAFEGAVDRVVGYVLLPLSSLPEVAREWVRAASAFDRERTRSTADPRALADLYARMEETEQRLRTENLCRGHNRTVLRELCAMGWWFNEVVFTYDTAWGDTVPWGEILGLPESEPPAFDTYWQDVILLIRPDEAAGSTTFSDNSPQAQVLTATGGAAVSATPSIDDEGSVALLVNGARIGTPNSALNVLDGDFTIEGYVYLTEYVASGSYLLGWGPSQYVDISPTGLLRVTSGVTASSVLPIPLNTWTHIAVSKVGANVRVFVTGYGSASIPGLGPMGSGTPSITVGNYGWNGLARLGGYLKHLRITKAGRYLANFTPPTGAFPEA